jgi:phosphoglycolate phosphatase-like HAD superfamily hydrolase
MTRISQTEQSEKCRVADLASGYDHIVFDCDGVLFDSNRIKESNIRAATRTVVDDPEEVDRFVSFFTGNNGVPREAKIRAHFPTEVIASAILNQYNALNEASVTRLQILPDAERVIRALATADVRIHVLSGGDEDEVRRLLAFNGVSDLIENICGGPETKTEHLERLGLEGRVCFFGDSALDYEVARASGFDFVFLHRYTQFVGWKEFFRDGAVRIEADFSFIES